MTQHSTLTLRPYAASDWDAISEIHDTSRPQELALTVGVEAFRSLAETYEEDELFEDKVDVAVLADRPVGFIAFTPQEITWLYVHPDHQRQGIAQQLLTHALARCEYPVSVSVLDGNTPAITLYENHGFSIVQTITGKLQGDDSVDATGHTMQKDHP